MFPYMAYMDPMGLGKWHEGEKTGHMNADLKGKQGIFWEWWIWGLNKPQIWSYTYEKWLVLFGIFPLDDYDYQLSVPVYWVMYGNQLIIYNPGTNHQPGFWTLLNWARKHGLPGQKHLPSSTISVLDFRSVEQLTQMKSKWDGETSLIKLSNSCTACLNQMLAQLQETSINCWSMCPYPFSIILIHFAVYTYASYACFFCCLVPQVPNLSESGGNGGARWGAPIRHHLSEISPIIEVSPSL